ncbi:hypothetical protein, partial [Bacteroides acidifaciens]|uniref:hypothetical protein n=1 Tax=Bacteroides acidifaciens TaxID=85831 RepID=UPI0025B4ECAA
ISADRENFFFGGDFLVSPKPCGQNYIELTLNKGNNLELTSCDSNICHHTVVTPCCHTLTSH